MTFDWNTLAISLFSSTAIAGAIAYLMKSVFDKTIDFKLTEKSEVLKAELSRKSAEHIEKIKSDLKLKTEKDLLEFKSKIELNNSKTLTEFNSTLTNNSNKALEKFKRQLDVKIELKKEILKQQYSAYSKFTTHVYEVRTFFKEINILLASERSNNDKFNDISKKLSELRLKSFDDSELKAVFKDSTKSLLFEHRVVLGEIIFSILHEFKHLELYQMSLIDDLLIRSKQIKNTKNLDDLFAKFNDGYLKIDDMYIQLVRVAQSQFEIE